MNREFKVGDIVKDVSYPGLTGIIDKIYLVGDYPIKVNFDDDFDSTIVKVRTYTLCGRRIASNKNPDLYITKESKIIGEEHIKNYSVEKISEYGVVITLENGFSFYRDDKGALLKISDADSSKEKLKL